MTMTSKERVQAALERKPTDRELANTMLGRCADLP